MNRLFNRNFTLLIAGQSFPVLGAAIYSVVMTLYLKRITDSAAFLGIIQMLLFLPPVVLGPLAGTLVDRTSRRTVIVVSDFLRSVCLVVLSIFTLDRFLDLKVIDLAIAQIHFSSYPFPVYAVCGATLLLGIIDSCFYSAMNVIVPEILAKDKIQKGNSLFEGVWGSLGVVGNALGGILFISKGYSAPRIP